MNGASPASEVSVYFDAPILHMSSKTPSSETPPAGPAGEQAAKNTSPAADAASPQLPPLALSSADEASPERAEAADAIEPLPERQSSPTSSLSNKGHARAASGTPSIGGKRSIFTNADGATVAGSTFINGAGTTGPNATAEQDESLHQRVATADAVLTEEQKAKIARTESKSNKQLAKIIKSEAKVEKKALNVAVKELGELQKIQKTAVKREEKAQSVYNKTLSTFQKHEAAFLAARSKYEASQALLTAHTEALEVSRGNAREATASMQDKSQEVDGLRKMFDVDEREREVKLIELTGKGSSKSRWSIMG